MNGFVMTSSISRKVILSVGATCFLICCIGIAFFWRMPEKTIADVVMERDRLWANCVSKTVKVVTGADSVEDLDRAVKHLHNKYPI